MDWSAVVNPQNPGYKRLWENIEATLETRGVVEGHGTGLVPPAEICAFAAAGISSDHEIREGQEAWDKLEREFFWKRQCPARLEIPGGERPARLVERGGDN